jgi:predicted nucleic acid-binding protein
MDYFMPMLDVAERRNLQEQIDSIRKAEEESERLKLTEDNRNDFRRNLKRFEGHLSTIIRALGNNFNMKPADFVGSKQDIRHVSKEITAELKSIHGVIEEVIKYYEKNLKENISKILHPIQTKKDFVSLKKTVDEFLKKTRLYAEYWEIIEKRKSLPGFFNRIGRGNEFREFDRTEVKTMISLFAFIFEEFEKLILPEREFKKLL